MEPLIWALAWSVWFNQTEQEKPDERFRKKDEDILFLHGEKLLSQKEQGVEK